MPPRRSLESTSTLLALVRAGDQAARNRLAERYLPALLRIAHGRLPSRARGMLDTQDLVQVTLSRALEHIETFEPRGEGAFLAFLRRILVNQITDETRRVANRQVRAELDDDVPSLAPSPLEEAIGRNQMERYESALETLTEEQQQAVILRIELGFSYPQIADALGRTSPNAVRMIVARAIVRIGERIKETEGRDGS